MGGGGYTGAGYSAANSAHGRKSDLQWARPAEDLAALLKRHTGMEIEPEILAAFIRCKWSSVSKLAHAIHEASRP